MAVPTGSGTETLHAWLGTDVDATQTMIYGKQHHVYTVLSVTIYCHALNATTDFCYLNVNGWNSHAGATANTTRIMRSNIQVGETYVWNDKFSFFGVEPTGISGTGPTADAYQEALAAQGGSARGSFQFLVTDAADNYDVTCTYLDQDWS